MALPLIAAEPRVIRPRLWQYDLLLTALEPISHHDADQTDTSNRNLFHRERLPLEPSTTTFPLPTQAEIDAFAAACPIPAGMVEDFEFIPLPEFVAIALTRLFIDLYGGANGGEGDGLFSGPERYDRLRSRLTQAAIESFSASGPPLRTLWSALVSALQVSLAPSGADGDILRFHRLPLGLQWQVRQTLLRFPDNVLYSARSWNRARKLQHESYATAVGAAQSLEGLAVLHWDATTLGAVEAPRAIDVPSLTPNSIRGGMLRRPLGWHLLGRLGIGAARPGQGWLPEGVVAMLENSGNIKAGAKGPTNSVWLAQQIRAAFPVFDLLGGVADTFDLGESALTVECYGVWRENAWRLRDTPVADLPALDASVFSFVDSETLTRQAGVSGRGQMIYGFETLMPSTRFLVRLGIRHWATPQTHPLLHGALLAAVETFIGANPFAGGQAARGFGRVRAEWLSVPDGIDPEAMVAAYEADIDARRDELLAGLTTGKLGADVVVTS